MSKSLHVFLIAFLFPTVLAAQVNGLVIDAKTQQPLPFAHVKSNKGHAVITNNNGFFSISADTGHLYLYTSYLGYCIDTVRVYNNTSLTIKLEVEPTLIKTLIVSSNLGENKINRYTGNLSYIGSRNFLPGYSPNPVNQLNQLAGIHIHQGAANTNRITIRGIGSRSPYGSNRIKAYYGNIPLTNGEGVTDIDDLDPEFISSIQLLKGPSPEIYDAAIGGAIVMQPLIPENNGVHFKLSTTAGKWNSLKKAGFVLYRNNTLAGSAGIQEASSNGYRDNSNYKRLSGLINNRLTKNKHTLTQLFFFSKVNAQIPSSINRPDYFSRPSKAADNWKAIQGYEDYLKLSAGLSWDYSINKHFKNSLIVYGASTNKYEVRPFNTLSDKSTAYGIKNLLQYHLKAFTFSAGADIYNEIYDWELLVTDDALKQKTINRFSENRPHKNYFARVNYYHHKWIAFTGINYSQVTFKLYDKYLQDNINYNNKHKYTPRINPTIGLSYQTSSVINVYLNFSQAFATPGVEETLLPDGMLNSELKPEDAKQIESGFRYHSFNQQWHINISVYQLWVKNLLVTKRITEEVFTGINAGRTEHQGIELSAGTFFPQPRIKTMHRFSIETNTNLMNSYFTKFIDEGSNFKGNKLPGLPHFKASFNIKYSYSSKLELSTNGIFTGKQWMNDANTIRYAEHFVIDTQVSLTSSLFGNLQLKTTAGINNVLNKKYAGMLLINAVGFGNALPRYYYPGLPRNYYVSLSVQL